MSDFFFDPSGTVIPDTTVTDPNAFDPSVFDPGVSGIAPSFDPSWFGGATLPQGVPSDAIPQFDSSGNIVGYYTMSPDNTQANMFGATGQFEGTTDPVSAATGASSMTNTINNLLGTNFTGQQLASLGLGVGTLGLGLGSGLASIFGGGPGIGGSSVQTQLSPQQRQALASAISGLNQIQNIALTGPTGVANVIGGMVGPSQQAYGQGLGLLEALSPQIATGQSPLQQAQGGILGPLSGYEANLMSGNLQIPPQLRQLIDDAYQGNVDQAVKQAVLGARNQGFAGGAELLARAPAAGAFGAAMHDITGQESASLLQALLQTIPQSATNAAQAFNTPVQNQTNSLNTLAGSLIGLGQSGVGNQLDFLRAATGAPTALGSIGTSGQGGGATQNTSQSGFNQVLGGLSTLGGTLDTLGTAIRNSGA